MGSPHTKSEETIKHSACQGRSEERCHKGRGDSRHVYGLHGGDALRGRQAGEGPHHEGRKGEEDPGHHPTSEGRKERQRKE